MKLQSRTIMLLARWRRVAREARPPRTVHRSSSATRPSPRQSGLMEEPAVGFRTKNQRRPFCDLAELTRGHHFANRVHHLVVLMGSPATSTLMARCGPQRVMPGRKRGMDGDKSSTPRSVALAPLARLRCGVSSLHNTDASSPWTLRCWPHGGVAMQRPPEGQEGACCPPSSFSVRCGLSHEIAHAAQGGGSERPSG